MKKYLFTALIYLSSIGFSYAAMKVICPASYHRANRIFSINPAAKSNSNALRCTGCNLTFYFDGLKHEELMQPGTTRIVDFDHKRDNKKLIALSLRLSIPRKHKEIIFDSGKNLLEQSRQGFHKISSPSIAQKQIMLQLLNTVQ